MDKQPVSRRDFLKLASIFGVSSVLPDIPINENLKYPSGIIDFEKLPTEKMQNIFNDAYTMYFTMDTGTTKEELAREIIRPELIEKVPEGKFILTSYIREHKNPNSFNEDASH